MAGRIAKVSPEHIVMGASLLGDAVYDYYEGVRTAEDPIRSAAGVIGSTAAYGGGAALANRWLNSSNPLAKKIKGRMGGWSALVPLAAGYAASFPGGWAADRVDEFVRPPLAENIQHQLY